ncbi:hypothetical protein [uncultured Mobiluncus sp.]|uniref:hypothetical protein n=1 Tax=uncultured Mobiluncus sp. TaxID=293425 RepID=UPI0026063391|nr:hypothetical protein [uncultured Mobiluncus sp.]
MKTSLKPTRGSEGRGTFTADVLIIAIMPETREIAAGREPGLLGGDLERVVLRRVIGGGQF